jgi:hypothetical protein
MSDGPQRLEEPALSEEDWGYLKAFHGALEAIEMEKCTRCYAKWFLMNLKDGVCQHCRTVDKKRAADEPFLYSSENNLFPGEKPDLPPLSQTEEMLIARIHVCMEVRQVRGHQYKYRGHVVNFLQNYEKVIDTLPLMPADLEIVLLRPRNATNERQFTHQFRRDFRVRRKAVLEWLRFLQQNHPGYHNITINHSALASLPEDGSVEDQLQNTEIDEGNHEEGNTADNGHEGGPLPTTSMN